MELNTLNIKQKESRTPSESSVIDISIPGLSRLVDPSYGKKKKIIWLITILICSAACLYLTVDRLLNYFSIPTTTKVVVQQRFDITFPALSLCSQNLVYGIESVMESTLRKECRRRGIECSDDRLKSLIFSDFNISLEEIWKKYELRDVEVKTVDMEKPIHMNEIQNNPLATTQFEFGRHDSLLGSCVYIRHRSKIPYISAATSLTITIHEDKLTSKEDLTYHLIPHSVTKDVITSFEFFTNEFEIIPAGYTVELKLLEEQFQKLNLSENPCSNTHHEYSRIKDCTLQFLYRQKFCRFPYFPKTYKECRRLSEIPIFDQRQFYTALEQIRKHCPVKNVCNDTQFQILIDFIRRNLDLNKNKTEIVIKMGDTVSISEMLYAYTFPALVSDLFAYWGFFMCLSALVFVEIFELLINKIITCCRKRRETEL